jgi:hypothetical protein
MGASTIGCSMPMSFVKRVSGHMGLSSAANCRYSWGVQCQRSTLQIDGS